MATIIRQSYIDKIERFLGKETIIVLVGQRRVGKSCMMKMIRDRKISDSSNNIIYIDKEKREFDHIQTYKTSRNSNAPSEAIVQNPTQILSSQVAMLVC